MQPVQHGTLALVHPGHGLSDPRSRPLHQPLHVVIEQGPVFGMYFEEVAVCVLGRKFLIDRIVEDDVDVVRGVRAEFIPAVLVGQPVPLDQLFQSPGLRLRDPSITGGHAVKEVTEARVQVLVSGIHGAEVPLLRACRNDGGQVEGWSRGLVHHAKKIPSVLHHPGDQPRIRAFTGLQVQVRARTVL